MANYLGEIKYDKLIRKFVSLHTILKWKIRTEPTYGEEKTGIEMVNEK